MSNINRRDRYALVALGLALLAIFATAWVSAEHKTPSDQVTENDTKQPQNSNGDDVTRLVTAIEHFDPWSDSYAQWIMAFFTIAATGVLVLTLRSADRTNTAAIKAAKAALKANEIMRQEGRPWLKVGFKSDESIVISDDLIFCKIQPWCKNFGSRPAIDAKITASLFFRAGMNAVDIRTAFRDFVEERKKWYSDTPDINTCVVFPGQRVDDTGVHYGRASLPSDTLVTQVYVFVAAIYKDPASDILHVTSQAFVIWGFEFNEG